MIFPAATNAGGSGTAFPDTCNTPSPSGTVPTPYPNNAMLTDAMANTCSMKVMIGNMKVLHQMSQISRTSGDEAGSAGGVVSGMIMGQAEFKNGSTKVMVEGQSVVHLTCMTGQNGMNANMPAGTIVAPSQEKVLVSP